MGVGLRIFLVNDDDSIQRLPLARYERLIRRDPKESLPQHAGKRVRYVEVALALAQRKPVGILRLQYFVLSFDSNGRIDAVEKGKERREIGDAPFLTSAVSISVKRGGKIAREKGFELLER